MNATVVDVLELNGALYDIKKLRNIVGNPVTIETFALAQLPPNSLHRVPAKPVTVAQTTENAEPYPPEADDPIIFLKKGARLMVILGHNRVPESGAVTGRVISAFALKNAKCKSQDEINAALAQPARTPAPRPAHPTTFNNAPRITNKRS